ncbi:MAG: hypothetical protein JJLCMIEE_00262 [Acidimicrobiales bacterium]|nr:MAG: sensor domain-containing diguanylate cyclase [Actinomycetota bacterium]MBV6507221.1 hypothetical protein [Acidimicrobiales bacterium]RIK05494.1 MAG: hypothetical protein DCC48_09350 [Acidobacteriota bacterium]
MFDNEPLWFLQALGDEAIPAEHRPVRDAMASYSGETLLAMTFDASITAVFRLGRGPLAFDIEAVTETSREQGLSYHPVELIHPDDVVAVLGRLAELREEQGFDETMVVRAIHAESHWQPILIDAIDIRGDDRIPGDILLRVTPAGDDITGAFDGIEPGEFESLAQLVPLGIMTADSNGLVVFTNDAADRILDRPMGGLHGTRWREAVHPDDREDLLGAVESVMSGGHREHATFRVADADSEQWVTATLVALGNPQHPGGWLATLEDVTERHRVQSALAHRATHDPLTGLPNRTLLEDRLLQAQARMGRFGGSYSVLFCDLDDFKEVNDRWGHRIGDEVLVEVSSRLQACLRADDTVARHGGDEFVVVCEAQSEEEARQVAQRLETAVAGLSVTVGDVSLEVGISVGLAHCSSADESVADLLARADQNMYRVKQRHHHVG